MMASRASSPPPSLSKTVEEAPQEMPSNPDADFSRTNKSNGPWNKLGSSQSVSVMGASSWPSLSHSFKKITPEEEGSSESLSDNPVTRLTPESDSATGSDSPVSVQYQTDVSSTCNAESFSGASVPNPSRSDQKKFVSTLHSRPNHYRPSRPSNQHHHHSQHHRSNYHNPRFPSHQRGSGFNSRGNNGGGDSFRNNSNNHYMNRRNNQRFHDSNSNQVFGRRPFHHQPQGFINGPGSFIWPPPPYSHPNAGTATFNPQYINGPPPPPPPAPGYLIPFGCFGEQYFSDASTPWYCGPFPYVDMMTGVTMTPPPIQMYMPQVDADLCNALLMQIEYYFSDRNLMMDSYLKSKMDDQGWVSVQLISEFKRVKSLTTDINLILEALRPSTVVEVQGDKMRRRGDWMVWVSPHGSVSSMSDMLVDNMKNLQLAGESGAEQAEDKLKSSHVFPNTNTVSASAEVTKDNMPSE